MRVSDGPFEDRDDLLKTEMGSLGSEISPLGTVVLSRDWDQGHFGTQEMDSLGTKMSHFGTEMGPLWTEMSLLGTEMSLLWSSKLGPVGAGIGSFRIAIGKLGTEMGSHGTGDGLLKLR